MREQSTDAITTSVLPFTQNQNNTFCPVPPQLCTGKRRRTNRTAQLTGHCKTGGTRSLAANHDAAEIVVVSGVVSGKQSESGFEYPPNAVQARRKGLLLGRGGCIEVCTRSAPEGIPLEIPTGVVSAGTAPAPAEKNREIAVIRGTPGQVG